MPDQDDVYGWTPDPQPPRRPVAESSGGGQYRHYRKEVVDSILTGGSGGSSGETAQQKRRPAAHIMASPLFSAPLLMCAWAYPILVLWGLHRAVDSHQVYQQGLLAPVEVS